MAEVIDLSKVKAGVVKGGLAASDGNDATCGIDFACTGKDMSCTVDFACKERDKPCSLLDAACAGPNDAGCSVLDFACGPVEEEGGAIGTTPIR